MMNDTYPYIYTPTRIRGKPLESFPGRRSEGFINLGWVVAPCTRFARAVKQMASPANANMVGHIRNA